MFCMCSRHGLGIERRERLPGKVRPPGRLLTCDCRGAAGSGGALLFTGGMHSMFIAIVAILLLGEHRDISVLLKFWLFLP
jgi:hypothetical protein